MAVTGYQISAIICWALSLTQLATSLDCIRCQGPESVDCWQNVSAVQLTVPCNGGACVTYKQMYMVGRAIVQIYRGCDRTLFPLTLREEMRDKCTIDNFFAYCTTTCHLQNRCNIDTGVPCGWKQNGDSQRCIPTTSTSTTSTTTTTTIAPTTTKSAIGNTAAPETMSAAGNTAAPGSTRASGNRPASNKTANTTTKKSGGEVIDLTGDADQQGKTNTTELRMWRRRRRKNTANVLTHCNGLLALLVSLITVFMV